MDGGREKLKSKELSIRNIYIFMGICVFIIDTIFLVCIFLFTGNITLSLIIAMFFIINLAWAIYFFILLHRKLVQFTEDICHSMDLMISGEEQPKSALYEETLLARINHRLIRLYEISNENRSIISNEKNTLQELISDISHQTKTPIANLKLMYSIMLEGDLSKEKRIELLRSMAGQLDKLDFLMQAMIKTSRLEAGVIVLEKKKYSIYETLADALGAIVIQAEKKCITVTVDCDSNLMVPHDTKWTAEALFNILDNAVKYTPIGGRVNVSVTRWEMYTKIDIVDNGKGVSELHQAKIFKRFYREEEVHEVPGIGIGLYIVRKIITLQGGYIKIASEVGKGTTFSVYLSNEQV